MWLLRQLEHLVALLWASLWCTFRQGLTFDQCNLCGTVFMCYSCFIILNLKMLGSNTRRQFHLVLLQLLIHNYLLQMILNLGLWRVASSNWTFLCLKVPVGFIFSRNFVVKVWFYSCDCFIVAIIVHFLLL